MCEEYNGWSNRETWATALHINNDEGLLDQINEYIKDDPALLSVRIEEMITEIVSEDHWIDELGADMSRGAKMMRDDIGSLWRVNWREIATSLLSDVVVA